MTRSYLRRGLALCDPFRLLAVWKQRRAYAAYLHDPREADRFRSDYLPALPLGGRVLDFGCGDGRHMALLGQLGFDAVGVDPVRKPFWRQVTEGQFVQGSDASLGAFRCEVFDLCVCILVLVYIRDVQGVLSELYRVLRPGGSVLLQVVNQDNLRTRATGEWLAKNPAIVQYFTLEETRAIVENTGFEVGVVWTEKFYSPVLPRVVNYALEVFAPRWVREYASERTNPRWRGLINVLAVKP